MQRVRNIGFYIALIDIKFLTLLFFDFLDWNKFLDILSALLPLWTTLFLAPNFFKANLDNPVVLNIEVRSIAILLKP